jgi:hypothetical protein
VKEGDILNADLKRSYLEALKEGMAARGSRGRVRGQGGRYDEDYWRGGPGWWNHGFSGPFPPPQFQPPYGFYSSPLMHPGPKHAPPHPQFPFPQYQVQHNQNFESRPRPNQQAARLRGAPQRPRQPGLKLKEGENAEPRKPIDMWGWKLRSRQT